MRISYSAIETFKNCPQKYKFQEIDKIRVPKSKEALFGSLVHDCLKFLFNTKPIPSLDQLLEYYKNKWPEDAKFISEQEEQMYFAEGVRMLSDFYRRNNPKNIRILALESKFEVEIPNAKDPKNPHILVGKIDRLDKIDDDTIEILDYKTSKKMPSQEEADKSLQLALYNLGVLKLWPDWKSRKIKLVLYFLRHGEKITTQREEKDFAELEKYIQDVTKEIEVSDFAPRMSPLCDWCEYKSICPLWKHLYKKPEERTASDEEMQLLIEEYAKIKKDESIQKKRLAEIALAIHKYLNENKLEQIFSQKSGVAIMRSLQERYAFDYEKVKQVLEPLNDWEKILAPDDHKLKDLLKALPPGIREEINSARQITKKIATLRVRGVDTDIEEDA